MTRTLFFWARVAAVPILVAALALVNPQHSITFLLFFLLLADVTSLVSGTWRDLLLVLTALALGLTIAEALADHLDPEPILHATNGFSVPQPVIGWGPKHAGIFSAKSVDPRTGATIYDVNYTIDPNLIRRTLSCQKGATVVFFGCSLTFGVGINDADTLPQILSDDFDRKLRIVNLGFGGYGPQQFLRELETDRFDKVIGNEPKLFVFWTGAFHVVRTSCKAGWIVGGPRYGLDNGKVVLEGACAEGRLHEWLHHTATYRVFVEPYREMINHDDVDLYIRITLAAVDLAKKKYGIPTLILYSKVPEHYLAGTGFTNDDIVKRLEEGDPYVLDVSLTKEADAGARLQIPGDGHPTPYANQLRATLLKTYIDQHFSEIAQSEAPECPASGVPAALKTRASERSDDHAGKM